MYLLMLSLTGCPKSTAPIAPPVDESPAPAVEAPIGEPIEEPVEVRPPFMTELGLRLDLIPMSTDVGDGVLDLLAVGPTGILLVAEGAPVRELDVPAEELRSTIPLETAQRAGLSPDGELLVLGAPTQLHGYGRADGRRRWQVTVDENVRGITFLPDGEAFAAAVSNRAELRSAADGSLRWSYKIRPPRADGADSLSAVAVSPDGRVVFVGEHDRVTALDAGTGAPLRDWPVGGPYIERLAVTPDGARALVGGWDKRVTCLELEAGTSCGALEMDHWVSGLAVSPDGRLAVAVDLGGNIKVLRVPGLDVLATSEMIGSSSGDVVWTLDGRWVVIGAATLFYTADGGPQWAGPAR